MPIEPISSKTLLDDILASFDYTCYAAVPGAGGNDAIFVIGKSEGDDGGFSFHKRVQRDICSKHRNEEGQRISVLPVRVMQGDALKI